MSDDDVNNDPPSWGGLAAQLLALVENRLLDPLEIILDSRSGLIRVRSRVTARPSAADPASHEKPGMIEEILPATVASTEMFEDPPDVRLFPEEEAVLARAVGKRRREFATARACARDALARLGLPPAPILPGERGAPRWPQGITGSITHCAGYRAAAVAWASSILTIGVDAEPDNVLPGGVLDAVSLPAERPAS
jgi:4'-phosphopantetheinyl transferase EntD